ncbi:unnamed protein product [Closterium sp. Yama58-4]|nr:unnamed protein product [Closterium sp. Yama58-4]
MQYIAGMTAGVETRVKLYSGKGHIDLTLQDLFRGGRDELVEDILEIVYHVDRHSHSHQSESAMSALDHAAEAASSIRPASSTSVPASQASAAASSATVSPGLGDFAKVQGSIPGAVIVPGEIAAQCSGGQCCVVGEANFSSQNCDKRAACAGGDIDAATVGLLPRPGMQEPVGVGPRAEALGPERKWMVPKVLLSAAKFISPF